MTPFRRNEFARGIGSDGSSDAEKSRPDVGGFFFDCAPVSMSLRHAEDHIALKHLLWCRYLDRARGRACWDRGGDCGTRVVDRECRLIGAVLTAPISRHSRSTTLVPQSPPRSQQAR